VQGTAIEANHDDVLLPANSSSFVGEFPKQIKQEHDENISRTVDKSPLSSSEELLMTKRASPCGDTDSIAGITRTSGVDSESTKPLVFGVEGDCNNLDMIRSFPANIDRRQHTWKNGFSENGIRPELNDIDSRSINLPQDSRNYIRAPIVEGLNKLPDYQLVTVKKENIDSVDFMEKDFSDENNDLLERNKRGSSNEFVMEYESRFEKSAEFAVTKISNVNETKLIPAHDMLLFQGATSTQVAISPHECNNSNAYPSASQDFKTSSSATRKFNFPNGIAQNFPLPNDFNFSSRMYTFRSNSNSAIEYSPPNEDATTPLVDEQSGLSQQPLRGSGKMLKCPRCNWHYKYQETLEIHMREKHAEEDAQCSYCLGGEAHPRLSRGEAYNCGYKPYRCDVCSYSTTTKGNLSIHMQSDRHVNNIQELHGMGPPLSSALPVSYVQGVSSLGVRSPTSPPSESISSGGGSKSSRPKPSWRCDVCGYETNVARNLRIHMTSEKHAHNILMLTPQSIAHHSASPQHIVAMAPSLSSTSAAVFESRGSIADVTSWAMSPFCYDSSLYALADSLATTNQRRDEEPNNDPLWGGSGNGNGNAGGCACLYQCLICNVFSTDSLEALDDHEHADRTRSGDAERESIQAAAGTYTCTLCQYKSNLKANFQLHCKTDKHVLRVQFVNHIREGGAMNELRHLQGGISGVTTIWCRACDFSTNSVQKMQMHSVEAQHQGNARVFVSRMEVSPVKLKSETTTLNGILCGTSRSGARSDSIHGHTGNTLHSRRSSENGLPHPLDSSRNIKSSCKDAGMKMCIFVGI